MPKSYYFAKLHNRMLNGTMAYDSTNEQFGIFCKLILMANLYPKRNGEIRTGNGSPISLEMVAEGCKCTVAQLEGVIALGKKDVNVITGLSRITMTNDGAITLPSFERYHENRNHDNSQMRKEMPEEVQWSLVDKKNRENPDRGQLSVDMARQKIQQREARRVGTFGVEGNRMTMLGLILQIALDLINENGMKMIETPTGLQIIDTNTGEIVCEQIKRKKSKNE